jgi:hypothetical protein
MFFLYVYQRETSTPYGKSSSSWFFSDIQWEIQDPKMEVLYHIRPYFVGIFPYIDLT